MTQDEGVSHWALAQLALCDPGSPTSSPRHPGQAHLAQTSPSPGRGLPLALESTALDTYSLAQAPRPVQGRHHLIQPSPTPARVEPSLSSLEQFSRSCQLELTTIFHPYAHLPPADLSPSCLSSPPAAPVARTASSASATATPHAPLQPVELTSHAPVARTQAGLPSFFRAASPSSAASIPASFSSLLTVLSHSCLPTHGRASDSAR
ncbi:hypothetical protein V8E36_003138 [Tilletia maclaganii]